MRSYFSFKLQYTLVVTCENDFVIHQQAATPVDGKILN
jgi:hypothetical protein